jgi:hypothetical protein
MDGPTNEPIADIVPMPDNALSELEMVTKNALAVGMLSTTDRRALGAMGYFAAETALLKPMIALGINNIHRNIHELIQSGVDPLKLWEDIMGKVLGTTGQPEQPTRPMQSADNLDDHFHATPEGYKVWLILPQTIKADDITILESSTTDLSVTLTRPPVFGEEDLAKGIDVSFPSDALVNGVVAKLNGNVLSLLVPRTCRAKHSVLAEPIATSP